MQAREGIIELSKVYVILKVLVGLTILIAGSRNEYKTHETTLALSVLLKVSVAA